jgi:hypothetical protein
MSQKRQNLLEEINHSKLKDVRRINFLSAVPFQSVYKSIWHFQLFDNFKWTDSFFVSFHSKFFSIN